MLAPLTSAGGAEPVLSHNTVVTDGSAGRDLGFLLTRGTSLPCGQRARPVPWSADAAAVCTGEEL